MDVSVADLKKNYDKLDVHFELWKGECDVESYIPDMVKDLKEKGLAYESEGALVVDVSEPGDSKELPPCIIVKSNGATLYATTDLATIVEREKLYDPDQIIYVADKRQSLHFTQVFRVAVFRRVIQMRNRQRPFMRVERFPRLSALFSTYFATPTNAFFLLPRYFTPFSRIPLPFHRHCQPFFPTIC